MEYQHENTKLPSFFHGTIKGISWISRIFYKIEQKKYCTNYVDYTGGGDGKKKERLTQSEIKRRWKLFKKE